MYVSSSYIRNIIFYINNPFVVVGYIHIAYRYILTPLISNKNHTLEAAQLETYNLILKELYCVTKRENRRDRFCICMLVCMYNF